MGTRFPAPIPSAHFLAESQPPTTSSSTAQAPSPQSLIESMSQSYDPSVQKSLKKLCCHSFVITDPHLCGQPIVYASDAFLHMSGYLAEEVLGRNPKFLQGPDTDRHAVCKLRDSICEQKPCQVNLLNYTKQGWPFQIALQMAPVFSRNDGRLLHFVGAQTPLYDCPLSLQKQTMERAPTLLSFQKWLCTTVGQTGSLNAEDASSLSYLRYLNGHWQTGICTGFQKTRRMKIGFTVLQLVIHELNKSNEMKSAEMLCGRMLSENAETVFPPSLTLALNRIQQSFVISNPKVPGMPVVYASDKFFLLTGYRKDEVIGHNCRFLQGRDTDGRVVQETRDCIKAEKVCTVRIMNYRKDGSPFWNLLHVAPVRDHTGKIVFFVGAQWDLGSSDCCQQTSDVAPVVQQLAAVGAVKVAVRSLQGLGLRRSLGP